MEGHLGHIPYCSAHLLFGFTLTTYFLKIYDQFSPLINFVRLVDK